MAAAAILDFQNFKFLMAGTGKGVELHQRAKFRENRLNSGRNMAIFQDGGRRHLGFSKLKNFNGRDVLELHPRAKFCQNRSNSSQGGQTAPACQIS